MRPLILLLLLALPTLAAPKKPPLRVLVSETFEQMAAHADLDWSATGAELVISLPAQGRALYYPGPITQADLAKEVKEAVGFGDGRPVHLSFYGYSEFLDWQGKKAQSQPHTMSETEWSRWLQRVTWLATEARQAGVKSLIMDSEIYPFTPGGNRGMMAGKAWRTNTQTKTRARLYARATAPLLLGTWVYWADGEKHAGFKDWWIAAGLDMALPEESFYGKPLNASAIRKTYAASVYPGLWKDWGTLSDSALAALCRKTATAHGAQAVWLYDVEGSRFLSAKALVKLGRAVRILNGVAPAPSPVPDEERGGLP